MNIANYEPWGGLFLGADGNVYNLVDLLKGGVPMPGLERNINHYDPMGGLIVGSDNKVYDLTALLQKLSMQLNEMPEASEEWANKIVQFSGEGDATFTNGYFYICTLVEGEWTWSPSAVGGGFSASFTGNTLVISG